MPSTGKNPLSFPSKFAPDRMMDLTRYGSQECSQYDGDGEGDGEGSSQTGDGSLLLTRLDAAALKSLPPPLRSQIDYEPLSRTGFFGASGCPAVARRVSSRSARRPSRGTIGGSFRARGRRREDVPRDEGARAALQ